MKFNKKNIKSDVKRKLVTGSLETVIGLAVLIFSLVKDFSYYLYLGILLIGSGAFTLLICLLRIFTDNAVANRKLKAEETKQIDAQDETQGTKQVNPFEDF